MTTYNTEWKTNQLYQNIIDSSILNNEYNINSTQKIINLFDDKLLFDFIYNQIKTYGGDYQVNIDFDNFIFAFNNNLINTFIFDNIKIKGDGNCLFYSLSYALTSTIDNYENIKKDINDYIKNNYNRNQYFVETALFDRIKRYLKEIKNDPNDGPKYNRYLQQLSNSNTNYNYNANNEEKIINKINFDDKSDDEIVNIFNNFKLNDTVFGDEIDIQTFINLKDYNIITIKPDLSITPYILPKNKKVIFLYNHNSNNDRNRSNNHFSLLLLDSINIDQKNCIINPTHKEDLQYNMIDNNNKNIFISKYETYLIFHDIHKSINININNYNILNNKYIQELKKNALEQFLNKKDNYIKYYKHSKTDTKIINEVVDTNIKLNFEIVPNVYIIDGTKLNTDSHINLFHHYAIFDSTNIQKNNEDNITIKKSFPLIEVINLNDINNFTLDNQHQNAQVIEYNQDHNFNITELHYHDKGNLSPNTMTIKVNRNQFADGISICIDLIGTKIIITYFLIIFNQSINNQIKKIKDITNFKEYLNGLSVLFLSNNLNNFDADHLNKIYETFNKYLLPDNILDKLEKYDTNQLKTKTESNSNSQDFNTNYLKSNINKKKESIINYLNKYNISNVTIGIFGIIIINFLFLLNTNEENNIDLLTKTILHAFSVILFEVIFNNNVNDFQKIIFSFITGLFFYSRQDDTQNGGKSSGQNSVNSLNNIKKTLIENLITIFTKLINSNNHTKENLLKIIDSEFNKQKITNQLYINYDKKDEEEINITNSIYYKEFNKLKQNNINLSSNINNKILSIIKKIELIKKSIDKEYNIIIEYNKILSGLKSNNSNTFNNDINFSNKNLNYETMSNYINNYKKLIKHENKNIKLLESIFINL